MRRAIVIFFTLIVNITLQSTILQVIKIRGVLPNCTVAMIVCWALLRGGVEGAAFGLFAGLLQDFLFGRAIGYHAILGMWVGYICGKPSENFYRENFFLPLFLCTGSAFLYAGLIYGVSFLFRGKLDFMYYFNNIILPETVYTAVVSVLIYRILYAINNQIEKREKRKSKMF